jgi:hypothetical protein
MNIERAELNQLLRVIEEHELSIRNVVNLINASQPLPTEMTLGDRTYEIISCLAEDEKLAIGHLMVLRANAMNVYLSKDDGEHILKHQAEIPKILKERAALIFWGWKAEEKPDSVCYIIYYTGDDSGIWRLSWKILANGFDNTFYYIRRKQESIIP